MKLKPKLIGWFVGQAMKATGGKANPQALNATLKRRLDCRKRGDLSILSVFAFRELCQ